MLKKFLAGLILAGLSLPGMAADSGAAAPAFKVTAIDGKIYELAKLKGKLVVLEWTNPGCPFVHKHYDSGNMQSLQAKYTKAGVIWISVDSSSKGQEGYFASAAEAAAWQKEQKASPTALVLDPDGTLGQSYGAKSTPHMFVIDKLGVLAYQGAIDDKPSTDTADIKTARNWVAEALDALLKGKKPKVDATRAYGCRVKYP